MGRCRGRGRGRAAAAAARRDAPAHDQQARDRHAHAGNDSDSGREDDEFRREAAQLVALRQPAPDLPHGLDRNRLHNAVAHLQQGTGLDKAAAEEALLSTAEHFADFESWVDEAQVWLAVQAETQEEAAKLKAAMHDSLALAQQEAALQQQEAHAPQAANMSEGLLRKRFAASTVLPRLDTLLPASMLFCGEPPLSTMIKTKLVELLRLENNCYKWYAGDGTRHYFASLADKLAAELQSLSKRSSSSSQTAAAAAAAAEADPASLEQPGQQQQQAMQPPGDGGGGAGRKGSRPPSADGAAAAAAGAGAGSSRRQSPAARRESREPSPGAAAAAAAVRASSRKRQLPTRFRSSSPSPAPPGSSIGQGPDKQQQHEPSSEAPPAKRRTRTPSESPAAAAADRAGGSVGPRISRSGAGSRRSASPAPLVPPAAAAAAAAAAGAGPSSASVLPAMALRPLCGVTNPAQLAMVHGLSRLLQEEIDGLTHAVFSMPDKAGAVPAIFKTADEQAAAAAAAAGSDSDCELVEEVAPLHAGPDPGSSPQHDDSEGADLDNAAAAFDFDQLPLGNDIPAYLLY